MVRYRGRLQVVLWQNQFLVDRTLPTVAVSQGGPVYLRRRMYVCTGLPPYTGISCRATHCSVTQRYCIHGCLLRWCDDFLANRRDVGVDGLLHFFFRQWTHTAATGAGTLQLSYIAVAFGLPCAPSFSSPGSPKEAVSFGGDTAAFGDGQHPSTFFVSTE